MPTRVSVTTAAGSSPSASSGLHHPSGLTRRPLLIVAASGLARETAEAAASSQWEPIGLLDDDPARWQSAVGGLKVLGGLDVVADQPAAAVVICVGSGTARLRIADRLAALGVGDDRWATVLAPDVVVPSSCSVGAGSVLLAGTVLTTEVILGRHVVCMPRVVLTHDDVVEDGATLCAGVVLGGSVRIGAGAYLGMGSAVRQNLHIGAGATVGLGAAVVTDVPAGQTWAGVPARPL